MEDILEADDDYSNRPLLSASREKLNGIQVSESVPVNKKPLVYDYEDPENEEWSTSVSQDSQSDAKERETATNNVDLDQINNDDTKDTADISDKNDCPEEFDSLEPIIQEESENKDEIYEDHGKQPSKQIIENSTTLRNNVEELANDKETLKNTSDQVEESEKNDDDNLAHSNVETSAENETSLDGQDNEDTNVQFEPVQSVESNKIKSADIETVDDVENDAGNVSASDIQDIDRETEGEIQDNLEEEMVVEQDDSDSCAGDMIVDVKLAKFEKEENGDISSPSVLVSRKELSPNNEANLSKVIDDWEPADGPDQGEEEEDGNVKMEVIHSFAPENTKKTRSKVTLTKNILPKKDLILAMEIAKHSQQGVIVDLDDAVENDLNRDQILEILESDQVVKGWRESLPSSQGKCGNDLDITQEVQAFAEDGVKKTKTGRRWGRPPGKAATPKPPARNDEQKSRERELALLQLAKDFKPRQRLSKGANINNVAAADLERALSSTPVLTGKRKRRPCYLPDEPVPALLNTTKTYTPVSKKNSEARHDVETALETIAIVNRHVKEENSDIALEAEPKQTEKKSIPLKKRKGELDQLLGDEGAVSMLYDTAKEEVFLDKPVFKNTKKGLEQKTKFVENTVMRLSGASEKSLRRKKVAPTKDGEASKGDAEQDALFPPAAPRPNSLSAKTRKKQKPAEASRILYRHSSSESFEGSEVSGVEMSPDRRGSVSPMAQRKSSRARRVSSKLSMYLAETGIANKITTPLKVKPSPTLTVAPTPKVSKGKSTSQVKVTERGGLVEIVLNSTKSYIRNGLTVETLELLDKALKAAGAKTNCTAVLLSSEGPVFCQGVDLSLLAPDFDPSPLVNAIKSLTQTLISFEKPVIAGVQGPSIGMGVTLLALCDVVVASDAACFETPYLKLRQGPEACATYTFPRLTKKLVVDLLYKGRILTVHEAQASGLVTQVVPQKQFRETLQLLSDNLATNPPEAVVMMKELLNGNNRDELLKSLDKECTSLEEAWSNPETLAAASELLGSGTFLLNA